MEVGYANYAPSASHVSATVPSWPAQARGHYEPDMEMAGLSEGDSGLDTWYTKGA